MVMFAVNMSHVARVLQGVAVVVAGSLFLYQVSLQVARYLAHPTTTSVNLILPPTLHMPPILICPKKPFNPKTLKEMGLDIKYAPNGLIPEEIVSLQGLNASLSAQKVWEDAGFILGNLIHNFTYGNISERYTASSHSSSYWRKVITPLGSCLALLLPPFTFQSDEPPAISINIKKNPLTSSCLHSHMCSPEQIKEQCNSTCDFERIVNGMSLYYYLALGRVYPKDGRYDESDLLEHLNFLLAEDVWEIGFLDKANEPLNIIDVDTTVVDRCPLSCDQNYDEFTGSSFSSCINSYLKETKGCIPVFPVHPNDNLTLGSACGVRVIQDIISEGRIDATKCQRELEGVCCQRQWIHEVKYGLDRYTRSYLLFQFRLSITSSMIRKEEEEEMYPFSQLASDIGGSLGLYLGISILSLSSLLGARLQQLQGIAGKKHKWNRNHCQNLLYWSVVSCLSFCTLLHCGISLQIYLTQVPRTTVIRATTINTPPPDTSSDNNIHDMVAARLASRALDCRPEPQPPGQQCVLDCLMTRALKQVSSVAPFVDVEDLPVCPAENGWKLSPKYVVPSLAFVTATDPLLVKLCTRWCEDQGLDNTSGLFSIHGVEINYEYYHITMSELLCIIGGIVGLYAGLFMSNVIPVVVNSLPDTSRTTKRIRRLVKLIMESFIYLCGIAMTIVLLHRYIFDHPISSKNSGHSLTVKDQPVITTCMWPPFKNDISINDTTLGPMNEIWAEKAWSERIASINIEGKFGRITTNKNDYSSTFTITLYNQCQITTTQTLYNNLIVSFYYWWSYHDLMLVSLHGPHDPPFTSQVYHVHSYKMLTLDVLPGRYTRLTQHMPDHTPSYTTCLYTCVHDTYSDRLGCRLPFVTWRQDLLFCTLRDALQYPTWPNLNEPPPVTLSKDSVYLTCHASCRHLKTEYYLIQGKESRGLEPGVNVVQRRSSFVDIEEVDWYPFSHLFNNLGVVAGFTFGTSILSLMFSIIRRLLPHSELNVALKPKPLIEVKVADSNLASLS